LKSNIIKTFSWFEIKHSWDFHWFKKTIVVEAISHFYYDMTCIEYNLYGVPTVFVIQSAPTFFMVKW